MDTPLPTAILFCCDHNSARSPMAEGLMKQLYGTETYVQSAGVKSDMDIDGFSVAVCAEIGIELSRHQSRTFEEMREWGDDVSSYDLIVALSPTSHELAEQLTKLYHIDVEYWPIADPTATGETREAKLIAYRGVRDDIRARMIARFGDPTQA